MGGFMVMPHSFTWLVSRSMWATTLRWPIHNIVRVIRWILPVSFVVPSSKLNLQIIDLLPQILQFPQLVTAMRPLRDIRHNSFLMGRSLIRVFSRLLLVVHMLLLPFMLPFLPPTAPWGSPWLISSPRTISNMWTFHSWTIPSSLKASSRVGFPQMVPIVVTEYWNSWQYLGHNIFKCGSRLNPTNEASNFLWSLSNP